MWDLWWTEWQWNRFLTGYFIAFACQYFPSTYPNLICHGCDSHRNWQLLNYTLQICHGAAPSREADGFSSVQEVPYSLWIPDDPQPLFTLCMPWILTAMTSPTDALSKNRIHSRFCGFMCFWLSISNMCLMKPTWYTGYLQFIESLYLYRFSAC
jgi:hypothetical protein